MKNLFLFFILLLPLTALVAQVPYRLNDSVTVQISNYGLLADKGYTIDQILSDSTLLFVTNDSLRPGKQTAYWLRLKIENPFFYAGHYDLQLRPFYKNTLYYFDGNEQKWVARETGITSKPDYHQRGDADHAVHFTGAIHKYVVYQNGDTAAGQVRRGLQAKDKIKTAGRAYSGRPGRMDCLGCFAHGTLSISAE